jgi:hypothetical protein
MGRQGAAPLADLMTHPLKDLVTDLGHMLTELAWSDEL